MLDRLNSRPPAVGEYYATAAVATQKNESESQIRNALVFSEELAAQLHSEIASTEHRLDTGLTPTLPTPATTAPDRLPGAPAPCSHLLERVATLNAALSAAVDRLRGLQVRIEL